MTAGGESSAEMRHEEMGGVRVDEGIGVGREANGGAVSAHSEGKVGVRRVVALAGMEIRLLLRNRTAVGTALVLPLLFGVCFAVLRNDTPWSFPIAMQVLSVLGLTVYVSVTTALAARRQDLTLKRLRCGEATDGQILAGVLAPPAVLGVVQGVLMVAIALVAGAPWPARPLAILAAIVGGAAVAVAVGLFTAAFTATPETAQLTTAPFFLATFAGTLWVLATPPAEVAPLMLAVPGAAVADLIRTGVEAPADGHPMWWPLLALAAWTAAAWPLGLRLFPWDRRS